MPNNSLNIIELPVSVMRLVTKYFFVIFFLDELYVNYHNFVELKFLYHLEVIFFIFSHFTMISAIEIKR